MPKYLIERDIPTIGAWSPESLQEASRVSVEVLHQLGPGIQWVHSYVTADKLYCIYIALNEDAIREHARLGGFVVTRITEIRSIIDPTTAER